MTGLASRERRPALAALCLLVGTVAACSSEGGSPAPSDEPIESIAPSPETLQRRLATDPRGPAPEAWLCLGNDPAPLIYLFLEPGAIPGTHPDHRLGIEIDPRVPTLDRQLMYLWEATSSDSVTLRSPDRGIQLDWSGVRFETGERLTVDTLARGTLRCTREGRSDEALAR